MAKKILLALSLFIFTTFFSFAQKDKTVANPKDSEVKEQEVKEDDARIMRRIELQVNKLAQDLNLTAKQVEDVKKVYLEFEKKSIELRNQLSNLNREKTQKVDELLTEEQLKLKREPRRRNLPDEKPEQPSDEPLDKGNKPSPKKK